MAGLTQIRLKRVQNFKLMSSMDLNRFGQLGSRKWGDELHTFLADKRVSRIDVQRWMEKERQVMDLLRESAHRPPVSDEIEPRRSVGRSSEGHSQSRSRSRSHSRSHRSRSQSLSSVGSEVSDHTLVPQTNNQNQNSAMNCEEYDPENPNFVSNSNPNPNVGPSIGNHPSTSQSKSGGNYSGAMEQQGPPSQPQPEVDLETEMKNISSCFSALKVLSNFCNRYEYLKTCHYQIMKMFRKLMQIQKMKINIVTPRINSPPIIIKQEVDENIYIGTTGTGAHDLDDATMNWADSVQAIDEINLTSETEQEDIKDPSFLQIGEVFSLISTENH